MEELYQCLGALTNSISTVLKLFYSGLSCLYSSTLKVDAPLAFSRYSNLAFSAFGFAWRELLLWTVSPSFCEEASMTINQPYTHTVTVCAAVFAHCLASPHHIRHYSDWVCWVVGSSMVS